MKGVWAIPIVFGIALMLGFPPVQSNAESSACDKIEELIAAGKIPVQVGLKLLEKADCDTQVVKITAVDASTGQPFEGAKCVISFDEGLIVKGLTDVNGEVLLIVPAELDLIRQTQCLELVLVPPGPFGILCNVSLNGVFTEIEIQIPSGGGGCF